MFINFLALLDGVSQTQYSFLWELSYTYALSPIRRCSLRSIKNFPLEARGNPQNGVPSSHAQNWALSFYDHSIELKSSSAPLWSDNTAVLVWINYSRKIKCKSPTTPLKFSYQVTLISGVKSNLTGIHQTTPLVLCLYQRFLLNGFLPIFPTGTVRYRDRSSES